MSQPHSYLPGTFYEVTRRCVDRAHKLTPNYASSRKYPVSEPSTAGNLEAAKRLIAEMRAFRKAHRVALEAVKAGKRRVMFPAGTGKMHFIYGYPREVYPLATAA